MAFACEAIEHARELRQRRDYPEVLERAKAEIAAMSPEERKNLAREIRGRADA